ncbi:MAG TPA: hypothetical protein VND92_07975 [Vicinamibacterales bacterium]|nr:hypothetical protein [Vicinamibacterales bacterium]
MIGHRGVNRSGARVALVALLALSATFLGACGSSSYEIPIQTPIKPKLDISGFQRVLVAGFVAGGGSDVDANLETVRLLRSQLRLKAKLKIIDADALPLAAVAREQNATEDKGAKATPVAATDAPTALPAQIKDEKDLAAYDRLFANTSYWKQLGEEYQDPLIVTGTILFTPHSQSGFVQKEQEVYDSFGRRQVVPIRTYMERKGFILRPKFIFIDGRTGATLYSETFREEVLYDSGQNTPALSSYFELMDRVMPSFLNTLSSQKIRGTRVLLK